LDYEYIEFHNAYGEGKATLVIDLRNLPPEIIVSFRLSRLSLSQPIEDAMTGVGNKHEADPDREPVPEVDEITFENMVYECKPSKIVKIEYVYIDPNEFCAAVLYINITRPLSPGSEYYFEVQQLINDDVLVGGSTYVIRSVDDAPRLTRSQFEEKEEEVSADSYIHPWLNPPVQFKQKQLPPWISIKDIVTTWRIQTDNDHSSLIRFTIKNALLINMDAIIDEKKIIAKIQPTDSGKFVIELPRYVIDATDNNKDSKFNITKNGSDLPESYEEIFTNDSTRVLSIDFENTTNEIHIKGTTMT
jgi:predicted  nucleic acid-binding Zn-ribbon protein